jgi:hypothetical protein
MNIAHLLARSATTTFDPSEFERLMQEAIAGVAEPALAGAGGPRDEWWQDVGPRRSPSELVGDFGNTLFATIAQPVDLGTMAETGRVGLLLASQEELDGLRSGQKS